MTEPNKRHPGQYGPEGDASPGDIAERELSPSRPPPGSPLQPQKSDDREPPRDRDREASPQQREEKT